MDHIAHPRNTYKYPSEKQYQTINKFAQSYDYTITLIKREKHNIIFENKMVLICQNIRSFHSRMLCVKFD